MKYIIEIKENQRHKEELLKDFLLDNNISFKTRKTKRYFQKCEVCKEKAFEFKNKPYEGMVMSIDRVIHKDNPIPGDEIKCQECKSNLYFFDGKCLIVE